MGSQLRIPHIKGEAVETMLLTVYQRYCSSTTGFMTLEGFIEFVEDSAVAQTHAPHDENDDVISEYQTLLDPVRLIKLVPRNDTATAFDSYYSKLNEQLMQASKTDRFLMSFSQFYQSLLRITEIIYDELYAVDATLAFSKMLQVRRYHLITMCACFIIDHTLCIELQEVICPLYVWSNSTSNPSGKHHEKRGSTDPLVLEARILLLMVTYAPNLWRVFLTYAQDASGKVSVVDTNKLWSSVILLFIAPLLSVCFE